MRCHGLAFRRWRWRSRSNHALGCLWRRCRRSQESLVTACGGGDDDRCSRRLRPWWPNDRGGAGGARPNTNLGLWPNHGIAMATFQGQVLVGSRRLHGRVHVFARSPTPDPTRRASHHRPWACSASCGSTVVLACPWQHPSTRRRAPCAGARTECPEAYRYAS